MMSGMLFAHVLHTIEPPCDRRDVDSSKLKRFSEKHGVFIGKVIDCTGTVIIYSANSAALFESLRYGQVRIVYYRIL